VIREGGPPDLPEMFWKDESHQRDRGSGRHQKGPQAPGIMGGETSSPTPDGQIAAFINRAPYRLFRLAGPRACPPLEGPITGFMWTPYLPVRDRTCLRARQRQAQTGTRWTSCHEPRNRDAAWRVISASFPPNSRPPLRIRLPQLSVRCGPSHPLPPPSTEVLRPSTCCAKFALDSQGRNPLCSVPVKPSSYHPFLVI
jgi:hypothetical protein